jgi:signal transduction histidine kinase
MRLAATALRSPRRRAALLAVLVVSALAIGATLTLEAWRSARGHRRAVTRALSGYADFAVAAYRQQLFSRLYVALGGVFRPLGNSRIAHSDSSLPAPSVLATAAREAIQCQCGPAMNPLFVFRFDTHDGSLESAGPALPAETRTRVASLVSNLGEFRDHRDWDYLALYDSAATTPRLVYVTAWRGADGMPRAIYGFAVELESLQPAFLSPSLVSASLLPVADRRKYPNDSLIAVMVTDSGGRVLARGSSRAYAPSYAATVTGGALMGGLQLRLALNPALAPDVLVGGLPPSRGPLLVGLLVLVAGVIGTLCVVAWQAAELARLRTEFVAAVSHELRTPLAQIVLFADSLRLGRIRARADVENAGDVIVGESRRLMHLVENILLFGHATRDVVRVVPESTALAPVVQDVVDFFEPQAQAAEARVSVMCLDEVIASVDPNAVRQVLLNLLDNATKYGPVGQTIGVGLALAGDCARLWVEDEGPGIPPPDRERIWKPFARLDRDVDANVAGSGIGLSVVREIVRQHGGRAWVESTAGGSARVVVEFPTARARHLGDSVSACAS